MKSDNYIFYTDGAYSFTRDKGGIGIVVIKDGKEVIKFSKSYNNTTNNQMELKAVITALQSIKNEVGDVTIITDSQYVIGCATKGWKRRKNKALWELFDKAFEEASSKCKSISFEWTKGHEDDKYNNMCDKLAVEATKLL